MHPEIDRFAHLDSPLHRLDPRLKIVAFAGFLVAVALVRDWPGALAGLVVAVFWLILSRIPLSFALTRLKPVILFLLPFLILLPLTHPEGREMGLERGVALFLKGLAMALTIFPMFGTTPFHTSMKALARLKLPERLVAMILFAYRYLFVFGEEYRTLQLALKARGFKARSDWHSLKTLGNLTGVITLRAFERTERIYQAMLARGFKRKFGTPGEFAWGWADALKSGVILLAALGVAGLDRIWIR